MWSTASFCPKRPKGALSIGVAIPRTFFPRSTTRNRLRRQMREAIRILHKEKEILSKQPSIEGHLLIRIQKRSNTFTFKAIQEEMGRHLRKLRSL